MRKSCEKNIEKQLEELCEKIEEKLNSKKKIDELQELIDTNAIASDINAGIVKAENETNKLLKAGFENILCDAIVRIKEYSGAEAQKTGNVKFDESKVVTPQEFQSFTKEEEKIKKLNSQYYMAKEKEEKAKARKRELQQERNDAKKDLRSTSEQKTKINSNKNNAIRNLGAEPAAETKYREEKYYVDRAGGIPILSQIGNFILGEKEKTRNIPYYDYTKRNNWHRNKNNIETKYKKELIDIESQEKMLMQKIKRLEDDMETEEQTISSNESKSLKKHLDAIKEFIAESKKKAMNEYLRKIKKELIDGVRNYLYEEENVQEAIMQNFDFACDINENYVEKYAVGIFEVSFNERLKALSDLIENNELSQKTSGNEEIINKIQNTQKTLEEIVCQM